VSYNVLFLGGPLDGKWKVVEHLLPAFKAFECSQHSPSALASLGPSVKDEELRMIEHIYVLQDFGQGMHFKTSLYVVENRKDDAMKMLIEGYRRP
jgi:hypothetical protein